MIKISKLEENTALEDDASISTCNLLNEPLLAFSEAIQFSCQEDF